MIFFIVPNTVPTKVKYFPFGSLKTSSQHNVFPCDCNHDLFMQIEVEYNIYIFPRFMYFGQFGNWNKYETFIR